MAVPRPQTPISLSQIHQVTGGELIGSPDVTITSVASLNKARSTDLAFVAEDRWLKTNEPIQAGALLAHRRLTEVRCPHIILSNPSLEFARVTRTFFCPATTSRGVAPSTVKGADVQIGFDVSIWPGVTLGDRVRIGSSVTIYPGVFVGDDSAIGDHTVLYPNVVVREGCVIGARVIIHSGTVVGSDGFGYVQEQGKHYKRPQLGGVIIEDDVELGANVTVDRATMPRDYTTIKQGTKVDNLVQIAHNVTIGEHSILVAQVGIAGSTTTGHHVTIGGQAGLANHIQIGDEVIIASRAGVNRNVASNQIVSGAPIMPHDTWLKAQAVIPRLPELRHLVRTLEERINRLEEARPSAPSVKRAKRKSRAR
ncbi:MAG TPA: UDP-3-O-(3-hydroxymyristoyl)glucosamine N-acyltransferase [Nitrospiraceae bacterium]|nr:UDP-3-O-(3-hydroxymyristoyl)glucosamine N-acyltransferase [Nitrospiraceae bacterium]